MKKNIIIYLLVSTVASSAAFSQGMSKFGSDEEACGRNYTIYFEHYKLKEYDLALPFWKKTIDICPAFSVSLWKNGEKMYKDKLSKATTASVKEACLDTLMWIYDQRMMYFGSDPRAGKGYVLGKKGVAQMTWMEHAVEEAYQNLKSSVDMEQLNARPEVIINLMKASTELFDQHKLNEETVLQDYEQSLNIVDHKLKQNPNDRLFLLARDNIETLFVRSGAANCEALISLYQKQFDKENSNLEWIQKVSAQLKRSGCTDHQFYISLLEAEVALNPEATEAHRLAQILLKNEAYDEAKKYLELSRELGLEDSDQAESSYELAYIEYLSNRNYELARKYAKEAIAIRPDWGDPYLLLGRIYIDARESTFNDDFEQTTVLWAAVDQFVHAKQADSTLETRANNLIKTYSALFPLSETIFFHTLKKGEKYHIGGWINEETTVRTRD